MLASYRALISVAFTHNYFADGFCRTLEFKPSAMTEKLLLRNQLLARRMNEGLRIIADEDALPELDENLVLRFYAQSADPYFSFYTAGLHGNQEPLYFSTHQHQAGLLTPAPFVELEDDPKSGKKITNPQLVIDVHLPKAEVLDAVFSHREYRIELQARALHWKYYFIGELAQYDLEIQDLASQDQVFFTNSNNLVVQNTKALLSQMPIVLSEVPSQKFQLKDKNNSGKVLLKRLPNAAVQRLGKEKDPEGHSILVAEIYINQ